MSAAEKIVHAATLADLEALPAHMKGELIDGVLYAMTRPRMRHQLSAGAIHADYQKPSFAPGPDHDATRYHGVCRA